MTGFLTKTYSAPVGQFRRMANAVLNQGRYNPTCSISPAEQTGQLILLTGGNGGIGLHTAKGLALRGAHVVIAARNRIKNTEAIEDIRNSIREQAGCLGSVESLSLDLSDLKAVVKFTKEFQERYPARKIDQLIENAGVWPEDYATSGQGHEIAFATNVLGHHLLFRSLQKAGCLADNARIIALTGDIYITSADCTKDYKYSGSRGGQTAYSRSKLGLMWMRFELHKQYPSLQVYIVHPGVVSTGLAGESGKWLKDYVFLSPEQGSQTALVVATAKEKELVNGAYYHNTCGRMLLEEKDPAMDTLKWTKMWNLCEELCKEVTNE